MSSEMIKELGSTNLIKRGDNLWIDFNCESFTAQGFIVQLEAGVVTRSK